MGDIDFYLDQRQVDSFRAIEKNQNVPKKPLKSEKTGNSFKDQKKLKSLKNRLSSIEGRISDLEKELAEIDHSLLMDYDTTIAAPNFFNDYQKKKKTLEELMEDWEQITLALEELSL